MPHEALRKPSRRTLLAGATAAAAITALPLTSARAHAAEAAEGGSAAAQAYRWRTVTIGGTGFITGVLFHPQVKGLAYARTDIGGAYRWDASTARWVALTDQLGWDDWNLLGVEAIALDPSNSSRVYLAL